MSAESPEQLLDAFKAAALSVTRLYKTSAAAQAKARTDGYQDCLDDLLAFLDRESIGLDDGEGWKIRRWATERLEGGAREVSSQGPESEDDADKAETASSPELHRPSLATVGTYPAAPQMRTDSAPPPSTIPAATRQPTTTADPTEIDDVAVISVPTQDTFNFQSSIPYPQEPNLNLASLDLSDSRPQDGSQQQQQQSLLSSAVPLPARLSRARHGGSAGRNPGRAPARLGKGAGQKRRMGDDLADIFNIGSLGYNGKDFFGGGKRSKHA
ncbi:hypothetical protein MAPG_11103 [Magnaporthiopsis poae ATCC 64411]|uniref:Uncharacterized protein n=1 Tax=Magnaporthiopsis poae (strain ATCC 64411 / 73-15) TaxID=644358 RepID=A0A0C4EED2_MAGP6|nr:hypothetical protein MAPG_11103 [Magnaporthiopsis poae ATCC 64411]